MNYLNNPEVSLISLTDTEWTLWGMQVIIFWTNTSHLVLNPNALVTFLDWKSHIEDRQEFLRLVFWDSSGSHWWRCFHALCVCIILDHNLPIITVNVIGPRKLQNSIYEFLQWTASLFKSQRPYLTLALLQQEKNASSFPLAKRWIALCFIPCINSGKWWKTAGIAAVQCWSNCLKWTELLEGIKLVECADYFGFWNHKKTNVSVTMHSFWKVEVLTRVFKWWLLNCTHIVNNTSTACMPYLQLIIGCLAVLA